MIQQPSTSHSNDDERTQTTMPEPKDVSVNRLSFPLQMVVTAAIMVASVVGSQAMTSAAVRNEIGSLRTEIAVMNTKQEVRDDFYRAAIMELKSEGTKQRDELQRQMKALEYVINEIKVDLAKRR